MDTIELVARNGDAVRQAIELGDIVHLDPASEELTDEFLLFAIHSGWLKTWADAFPDPRQEAEIGMEVLLAASSSARFAGLYSFRKRGDVLQSARVLGALGYSVAVTQGGQGRSRRVRLRCAAGASPSSFSRGTGSCKHCADVAILRQVNPRNSKM